LEQPHWDVDDFDLMAQIMGYMPCETIDTKKTQIKGRA
jgi:hypothetical protein